MSTATLLDILKAFDPSVEAVIKIFDAVSTLPPGSIDVILAALDTETMAKWATWAQTYVKHITAPQTTYVDPGTPAADTPLFSSSFDGVMAGTVYQGGKLSIAAIEAASRHITEAIKASNWAEAIKVGIQIGMAIA
jgi:hypothetical protein